MKKLIMLVAVISLFSVQTLWAGKADEQKANIKNDDTFVRSSAKAEVEGVDYRIEGDFLVRDMVSPYDSNYVLHSRCGGGLEAPYIITLRYKGKPIFTTGNFTVKTATKEIRTSQTVCDIYLLRDRPLLFYTMGYGWGTINRGGDHLNLYNYHERKSKELLNKAALLKYANEQIKNIRDPIFAEMVEPFFVLDNKVYFILNVFTDKATDIKKPIDEKIYVHYDLKQGSISKVSKKDFEKKAAVAYVKIEKLY